MAVTTKRNRANGLGEEISINGVAHYTDGNGRVVATGEAEPVEIRGSRSAATSIANVAAVEAAHAEPDDDEITALRQRDEREAAQKQAEDEAAAAEDRRRIAELEAKDRVSAEEAQELLDLIEAQEADAAADGIELEEPFTYSQDPSQIDGWSAAELRKSDIAFVPRDVEFPEDGFREAPIVKAIGQHVIARDNLEAARYHVIYRWRRHGGKTAGRPVLGKLVKLAGLTRHAFKADYLVWIGADHVRDLKLTNHQLEAAIYHELLHIDTEFTDDGDIRSVTRAHDFEGFIEELAKYGNWKPGSIGHAEAWQQRSLLPPEWIGQEGDIPV